MIGAGLVALGASRAMAQGASFTGAVLAEVGERPLVNAEVLITDLKLASRSDSAGRFLLTGVTAGKHPVLVRLVGYESFTADITFGAAEKVDADILLTLTSTKLKTVKVKAKPDNQYAIRLAEFEERRRTGIGRFLTADVFDKEDGRPPSSFLAAHIPGLRIVQSGSRHWIASTRGGGSRPKGGADMEPVPPACYMQVIVNGIMLYNGSPGQRLFDIDQLDTKDIVGFEFHTVATQPLQYNGTSGATPCGTVIIWTK